jgi:cytochrome c553
MTSDNQQGLPDSRFTAWIVATAVLFIVAAAIGFIWLPSTQQGAGGADLWTIICRAIGLPTESARDTVIGEPPSTVAWTPAIRRLLTGGDAARGASLANNCNNCHGTKGISSDAAIPNLVGQTVAAIYKQLEDYKSGKRDAAVMGVFISQLSQQDLLDLAAHFASLPNPFDRSAETRNPSDRAIYRLVENGDPMRGVASCAACHGPLGFVPGAPELRGQQRAYSEQQLLAFKSGNRHNDINEQMRSVARQLTNEEIASLAAYYSSIPAGTVAAGRAP